ncbi:ABC transporter [Iodidimonas gelatinilytica]|uniref:ABC transporter n=1 Tax=Iodidimonas gelatinilytica TaxID=1236966 RepID=A0A5A7MPU8_9PROT|nr:ABC transporter ATP-binding protein [Iodidimonas gelatinilytica]GEQ97876.1 ABC transporter [Iodidimonas gelatinilytica]
MTLRADHIDISLGGRKVVHQASLHVAPGELVALIGPNGAGKSTLLKALAGLLPVDEGRILPDVSVKERARLRAWLGQDAAIHWPVTVARLVSLGRLPHLDAFHRAAPSDREAIQKAMAATDCLAFARRPATHLSAGERARALLARAFATQAPFILADEPAAALDPYHAFQMMELLRHEAQAGRGVLVVLHDLNLAARFAHRVVLMAEGAILADGAAQTVLSDDLLGRAYGIRVARGDGWLVPISRLQSPD